MYSARLTRGPYVAAIMNVHLEAGGGTALAAVWGIRAAARGGKARR